MSPKSSSSPSPSRTLDFSALLTDISQVRQYAPVFVAALEIYFEEALNRETKFLARPTAATAASKTPQQLAYALGLRDGLIRGRFVFEALEHMARRAIREQQKNAISNDAAAAAAAAAPAAGAAVRSTASYRAPTPGIARVPDWVGTGGGSPVGGGGVGSR